MTDPALFLALSQANETALIAVGGSLAGVVVGGVMTSLGRALRERRAARAARELVLCELDDVRDALDDALTMNRALVPEWPRLECWREHRALLARHYPRDFRALHCALTQASDLADSARAEGWAIHDPCGGEWDMTGEVRDAHSQADGVYTALTRSRRWRWKKKLKWQYRTWRHRVNAIAALAHRP